MVPEHEVSTHLTASSLAVIQFIYLLILPSGRFRRSFPAKISHDLTLH